MTAALSFPDPTLDDAWQKLQCISAVEREDWLRVGMALKSEFGDAGFSTFDQWSKTAQNYDAKAVTAVWRSFRGQGVSFGSLVYLAHQNGYRDDARPSTPPPAPPKKSPPPGRGTAAYALDLFKRCNKDDAFVMAHPYAIKKDFQTAAGGGRLVE